MENEPGAAAPGTQSGMGERLKRDSKETVETGKRSAADHIGEVARAIDQARAQLEQSEPALAAYAGRIATRVGNLATRLREASVEELAEDTRQLARSNPALYLTGAMAVGFLLARFLKASAQRSAGEAYSPVGVRERGESASAPLYGG